jgi:hypothetical protein
METLKTLLALLARLVSVERIGAAAGRAAAAAALGAVAVLFVVAALGCAAAALWLFALPYVGPVYAPLIVAGVLLLIALVILAVARGVLRRQRATPASVTSAELAALLEAAEPLLQEHKGTVLLAALVAGLVAGGRRSS